MLALSRLALFAVAGSALAAPPPVPSSPSSFFNPPHVLKRADASGSGYDINSGLVAYGTLAGGAWAAVNGTAHESCANDCTDWTTDLDGCLKSLDPELNPQDPVVLVQVNSLCAYHDQNSTAASTNASGSATGAAKPTATAADAESGASTLRLVSGGLFGTVVGVAALML
ncbi:hypothetical protein JCM10213_006150 [Rhodosporidiobolus nylandii]